VDVPVLCKDFVVDPVQLFVARGHGADAVLLIASVLGDMIPNYVDLATTLGLTPVVEVAHHIELPKAWGSGAPVIAVNSRDLRTLKVDPEAQVHLIEEANQSDALVVAASGIKVRADVERVAAAGARAVLVGETLMRAPFPEDVLGELTGVPIARER
jgi:indole-3-glycerol phosphate synthase